MLSPILLRPHLMTPAEANLIVTAENLRGLQLSGPETDSSYWRQA